jgi:tetratricopeptide (TPR) repeat protein
MGLATRLRTNDGLDVTLDRWDAQPGDELTSFMEKGIRDSGFVLLICTPTYKAKFDARIGGVGYEAKAIAGEIFAGLAGQKIIPIHRKGAWKDAAPSILLGNYYVDLSAEPYAEANYRMLIDRLHGRREIAPPIAFNDVRFEGPLTAPVKPVLKFTGRDDEMHELVERLRSSSEDAVCVIVSGVGGVGKTSLARQLVATRGPSLFPGGAAWLDGVNLVAELARICRRLGWAEPNDPTPQKAITFLAWKLHDLAFLLVVDSFPQTGDRKQIPIPGGRCRTLITSRTTEVAQDLDVPVAAIRLSHWSPTVCRKYLREVVPRLAGEPDANLDALAGFVQGLPLAVRLIARALDQNVALSAKQHLECLYKAPLDTLDAAAGATDRAVAATFLEAYHALSPVQQATLRALSSSAQGTRTEIIAAVAHNAVGATEDALNALHRFSLADYWQGTPAPWGLHDMVRLVARSQPETTQSDAAHLAWVKGHFTAHAAPFAYEKLDEGIPEALVAFARLVEKRSTAEASEILDRTFAHLRRRGRYAEAAELIERLLGALPTDAEFLRAVWLGNRGVCSQVLGDFQNAIEFHQRALAIYEKLGVLEGQAEQLGNLGNGYETLGDIPKAIDFFQRSFAIDEKLGRLENQAGLLGGLGLCYKTLGDISKAVDLHERSLSIYEKLGLLEQQAIQLGNLGNCYKTLGDIPKATDLHQHALAIDEKLGRLEGQANHLNSLGNCYRMLGDIPRAISLHERSFAINEKLGRLEGQANQWNNLGLCYQSLGDIPKAIDFHQRALAMNEKLGLLGGQAAGLGNLGLCHMTLRDIPKAIDLFERSLAIDEKLGRLEGQANQCGNLGLCYATLGHLQKATGFLQRSLANFREMGLSESHQNIRQLVRALEWVESLPV